MGQLSSFAKAILSEFGTEFYPYNKETIDAVVPLGLSGVYGLRNQIGWVYVGKGAIRDRLMDHLNGDNACISSLAPTVFTFEVTNDMAEREKQLILSLNPMCNKRVG